MNAGVTAEQARAIVESVVTSRRGPVSVVVADDRGEVVASLRMDGAALDTMLNAQRKAYTAARSGATTTRELSNTDEDLSNFDPFFTFFLGGVAVFEGNRRVGAVGVSGLPGEVDEELAIAAIRAAGLEVPAGL